MIPLFLFLTLNSYSLLFISSGEDYVDISQEPWFAPGTVAVTVNGDSVDVVTASRGASVGLVLSPSPDPGDTVLITADTLAISAMKVVRLEIMPLESGGVLEMPSYRFGTDPVPEGLYISGSKKLGVSIGSGGGITQGTELSIQGILAPGITVNGRISDRDIPLGAASSEVLSELDRVYVELQGESWNVEMGDLQWEREGPVPWRNDLTGFHAGVIPVEDIDLSGGFGTTGSERRRSVFLTQEGVQGPYSFSEEGGVTPGSERLFLDGERLQRGTGADYEVDYAAGLVTFTTKRLIRRDQRVEISYYREGDGFRKNISRGDAVYHLTQGISLGFNGFSRGDDTDAPLGFVMTDEIEDVLRNAGEDPAEAWIDGGRYVGDGNGSYTLDSLSRYIWEGPGLGDWTVEFQRPPEGTGDYVYDSAAGGYLWAGEGQGSHLPRRYLSIPSSNSLGGLFLDGEAGFLENFNLHSTFSGRKGNLFNPDVTTREGTLSGGSAGMRPWETGPLVTFSGRFVSDGFNSPDDLDTDSDLRRWGLPSSWPGKDSFSEIQVSGDALSLNAGRRVLEPGGSSDIAGVSINSEIGRLNMTLFTEGLFRSGNQLLISGKSGKFGADVFVEAGAFTPFLDPYYLAESWEDSLSGGMFVADAGITHEAGGWNTTVSAGGEFDNRTGITHPDRTFRLNLLTRGSGVSWNTGGSFQHSTGWFEGGGSTSAEAVRVSYSGRHNGVWFHSQYSAGGYISREMDIVYTWVGAGNGNFSYDPQTGEYYSDPSGDYIQSYVPGQGDTRVLEADLNGGFSWSDSTDAAGLDGSFGLSASDPENRLATYTLAGAFDTGSPGEWNGSLSPFLAWEDGTLTRLTLRVSGYDRRDDYSGVGTTREFYRKLEVIPLLKPEEWLELQFRGFTARRRRALYGDRETLENGISADPTFILDWGLDVGIKVSLENRREIDGDPNVSGWGLEPHTSLNSSGWTASGRFTAWYIPDSGGEALPVWFFDGRQNGWTMEPSLSVGRNLNRWFRLSLFYWGRRQPDTPWEQRGGIEGTVNF